MIIFQAKYLKQLMQFVADQDIRYYMRGIYAEPHPLGGALLVATNGHMLCAIHDAQAKCTEPMLFYLKKDALKFSSQKADNPAFVNINSVTERLTISTAGAKGEELYIQPGKCIVDSAKTYPQWKRLLPNFADLKPGYDDCVSVEYVRMALSAVPTKNGRHYSSSVRFWQTSQDSAIFVQITCFPEILCIIMPMREENGDIREKWEKTFPKPPKVEVGPVSSTVAGPTA